MPEFGVFQDIIDRIETHPNADKLEIVRLKKFSGYNLVVQKGKFLAGQGVLYFPIDSVIPENLQEILGVKGYLAGAKKDRVKTVMLRSVPSQGLVVPLSIVDSIVVKFRSTNGKPVETDPTLIAELLGVTKYEPPVQAIHSGKLTTLPRDLSVYDIDGVQSNADALWWLYENNIQLLISEKVEGSNSSITVEWNEDEETKIYVNQRRHTVVLDEGKNHFLWDTMESYGLPDALRKIEHPGKSSSFTIYGECIGPGIQGNYYGLKKHRFVIFDVKDGTKFLPGMTFANCVPRIHPAHFAPSIRVCCLKEKFGNEETRDSLVQKVIKMSHGHSMINPNKLREGIVLRPYLEELTYPGLGRMILKVRDPIYLDKTGN